ncbi:MAG: DUF6651 domain-containing protein [Pseudomonadota bacterium]
MPFEYDATGAIVTQEVNGQKLPVYVHADGKKTPFDGDGTLSTISRLNGEAKTHREAKEALELAFKPFKDAGITDAAAALKALNTVKNLDDKKLVDAGEVEKVKSEVQKAMEQQYAPVMTERDTLRGQLNDHLIGGVFTGSKFVAEKIAAENGAAAAQIARALFGQNFKVKDGKVVAVDGEGKDVYSRARPGELADTEEALQLIVESSPLKASILKGTGASGGGAAHGSSLKGVDLSKLSPVERMNVARGAPAT